MSRIWVARAGAGGEHQDVCADELEAMGIHVPTDRPILVEFTARVVPEGDE